MEHDEEAPPPPYSAIDPLQSQVASNTGSSAASESQASHHDLTGYGNESQSDSRPLEASLSEVHIHDDNVDTHSRRTPSSPSVPVIISPESLQPESSSSALQPTHFASAAGYFADRGFPSDNNEKRDTLVHHMTIYARSQCKDFPRRPRCWRARAGDISQHDWDTFLNFLFPSSLGPAALSSRLHRRVRAEIERDRKDRPQETDDERCARLDAVITEWNDYFFNPRGTYVTWVYIADLENGPASPLCPNCYPQATEASRNHATPLRTMSYNAPIPVSTEQPAQRIPRRPVPRSSYPGPEHESQRSSVSLSPIQGTTSTTSSPTTTTALGHPATVPLPKTYQTSYTSTYPWATNPVAWASQMSLRAQQYAGKISTQAQEYGKAIEESALARSRQVEQYSKKLEGSALARGRQIEEAALAKGRRIELAGDRLGSWATGMTGMVGRRRTSSNLLSAYEETDSLGSRSVNNVQPTSRRLSTASSTGSIESLSSIDSISTTSELEPDDLAAMRAQLSSLDEYHHRDLHSATVSLRGHLRILQQTRHDSRFLLPRVGQRGSWGRWDSPEDEKQRENRRVLMKEETRLLREAFRESDRRAKQEVRELQRTRRSRKLQRQQHHNQQHKPSVPSLVIDKTTSNLELGADKEVLMPAEEEENEPIHRPASHPIQTERELAAAATAPSAATGAAPAMNPHEAAKAWANAQRTKAKELHKANKNKLKEIQKQHKQFAKEQRKLAKKNWGRHHGLTSTSQVTLNSTSSTSSLSLSAANLAANHHRLSTGYTDISSSPRQPESTSALSVRSDPNVAEAPSPVSNADWQRQRSDSETPHNYAFELEGDNELLSKR